MSQIDRAYAYIYERTEQAAWSEHMASWALQWLAARNITPAQMINWGRGTGAAARIFAARGWQVTAIGASEAMLALARKSAPPDQRISWIKGDLCRTDFVQPALLATAFYDTLNYQVEDEAVRGAWRSIAAALVPGGYAIADIQAPDAYKQWRGQHVITADTDEILVINRLRYNERTKLARRRIVWFAREDHDQWRRGAETQVLRAHTDAEITAAIAAAGLHLVERHTQHNDAVPARIIYVARKPS